MCSQYVDSIVRLHVLMGWIAMALGVLSGAAMGMFFHREEWLGGYGSVQRRMLRLGHIAFFGMAFLNFSFALTVFVTHGAETAIAIGSYGLAAATVSMPAICLLSVFRGINRAVFSVPVAGTVLLLGSVFATLYGTKYL